jgi:hypothetical protein
VDEEEVDDDDEAKGQPEVITKADKRRNRGELY